MAVAGCRSAKQVATRSAVGYGDVVGALRHVHVVDGVQRGVVALLAAEQFQRAVGDDLVGVHVGRGAGAALDDVDDELVVQFAAGDFLAGRDDGVGASRTSWPSSLVRQRCRLFDHGQRA